MTSADQTTRVTLLLSQLIGYNSIFGNERKLADWLNVYLEQQGFGVRRQRVENNRFNLLAERGEGRASLVCYGHMDTVPVYSGWQTNPFVLTKSGDKLLGLGACDMKGGIASLLAALERLPRHVPIKVLLAVDEENASAGAWRVVDGRRDWMDGVTHILSAEPGASADRIGGSDVLTLGRRGRARFRIKVHGMSAHGGHVDRGVNAIDIASRIALEVAAFKPANHPRLREGSHYVACVASSTKGLSIPEYCELEIERHLVLPETVDECLSEYRTICQAVLQNMELPNFALSHVFTTVEIVPRRNKYMEPYETPNDDVLVNCARKAINSLSAGQSVASINYGRSVGDENVFANELGVRPVILGPEGGNMHSPDEWVSETSLGHTARVYEGTLLNYWSTSSL